MSSGQTRQVHLINDPADRMFRDDMEIESNTLVNDVCISGHESSLLLVQMIVHLNLSLATIYPSICFADVIPNQKKLPFH